MFNENFSLEVFHFVLDANREQSCGVELKSFAVAVEGAHRDMFGASDFFKNTRYR